MNSLERVMATTHHVLHDMSHPLLWYVQPGPSGMQQTAEQATEQALDQRMRNGDLVHTQLLRIRQEALRRRQAAAAGARPLVLADPPPVNPYPSDDSKVTKRIPARIEALRRRQARQEASPLQGYNICTLN